MSRTVIVTPFGKVSQLAAVCTLKGVKGHVVPVGKFSAVVFNNTSVEQGNSAAAALSDIAGKHEILLLVRSDEHIDAGHFRNGKREADVPAGLALSNLPATVEKLLLETVDPADIEGHIDAGRMSKYQASASTMTPQRVALAKTALLWAVVAVLALIGMLAGVVTGSNTGSVMLWIAAVVSAVIFAFSVLRIYRLLVKSS